MTRKNKIMAAAAAVALLLLVGSGVARCTLATEGTQEAEKMAPRKEQGKALRGVPRNRLLLTRPHLLPFNNAKAVRVQSGHRIRVLNWKQGYLEGT